MRIHRLPIAALTSAGLLFAGAAPAADPPFQTPSAPKPDAPPPASPPAFDVAPSDAPTSPGRGAQPAPPAPPPSPPPAQPSPRAGGDVPADLPSPSPPAAPPPRILPIEGGDAAPSPPPRKSPRSVSAAPAPPKVAAPRTTTTTTTKAPITTKTPPKKSAAVKPRSRAEKRVARASTGGPAATYPGFRLLEGGGSRVFVKIAGKVSVAERKGQGQHVIALSGVSVPSRNDRRPLDTSFFPTPVSQVRLVPHEGGADLIIELKQPSEMQLRVEELRDGIVVMIDFPRPAGGPSGALP